MEIQEIREFKTHQVGTRHQQRVSQQRVDQSFFEDTYEIPFLKGLVEQSDMLRAGFVSEMVNGITQQAVSSQPKVYVSGKEGSARVASALNRWVQLLSSQATNPFRQVFKQTAFTRGEAWIYTPHKAELITSEQVNPDKDMVMPVHFIFQDPLVVFADPSEFVDGRPTRIVVSYKRRVSDIKANYPLWETDKKDNGLVNFLFYVDKDTLYAEAEEIPLFREGKRNSGKLSNGDGRRKNIYGFIPFAHCYSGFGQDTEEHNPELLAFSRIRMIRDKILLNSAMANAFRFNIIDFAWRGRTLLNQSGADLPPDIEKDYHPTKPGTLSKLTLPAGANVKVEESQLFEAPVFAYWSQIKADLEQAYPGSMRGVAQGTSGRQEDILSGAGLSFYDAPVENNASLWARAFENALKVSYQVGLIPEGLRKGDIDSFSEIEVALKAVNPLERLRDRSLANQEYQMGIKDLKTCLIEGHGKSEEEAEEIMARQLADAVTRNDPIFRQIMGIAAAREMGVEDEFNVLAEKEKALGVNPVRQFGKEGGEPRTENVKTLVGRELADIGGGGRPVRRPPGV